MKGDPYLRDMKHTKSALPASPSAGFAGHTDSILANSGHVADLTAGCWNPKNGSEFITSSNDSTVRSVLILLLYLLLLDRPYSSIPVYSRIWDVENKRKQKTVIVVKSKERGTRTKITTCAFSPDGKHIGAGSSYSSPLLPLICSVAHFSLAAGLDGTLHVWATNSNFARPNMTKEGAHAKDTETSSMCFSIDGRMVASRGGDDTVKREPRSPDALSRDAHIVDHFTLFSSSLGHPELPTARVRGQGSCESLRRHQHHLFPRRPSPPHGHRQGSRK